MTEVLRHVYPLNDEREHDLESELCPCLPRVRDGVAIHNSYDGREVGEVCAKALDLLALSHVGRWTEESREAYEHAIDIINMHYEMGDG